jgi:ribosomal protein S18 acetylase RimI-like enzyme
MRKDDQQTNAESGSTDTRRAGAGDTDAAPAIAIRPASAADAEAIWRVLEPAFRRGDTYALPSDITREQALAYWCAPAHAVFVAEIEGEAVGTYYLRANHAGGGAHVANCGYVTAAGAGRKGVGRAMGLHSLAQARARGYRAMQFNFVVASNERAIRLWRSLGFAVVGRLPDAFRHPRHGYVDALVMHRTLDEP